MARPYEILVHGSGFHAETGDGAVIRGFYASRRVRAEEPFEANAIAVAAIQAELAEHPDFQKPESRPAGSTLTVEECYPLGWIMRFLTRAPRGFIFYEEEE